MATATAATTTTTPRRTATALPPGRRTQASITTGTIIGRRFVRSLTNLPAARRTSRSRLSTSRTPWRSAAQRPRPPVARLVEQVLGLGRVDPATRDDLGTGEHLARSDVDGDEDHDHALLGEHAPVAQHAVADVADDAVDVQVAGRHAARLRRARRRSSSMTSPSSHTSTWSAGDAHHAARAGRGHQVAVLAVHRHEPLGLRRVSRSLQLFGLGVARDVHVGDAGVDHLGAGAEQAVDDPVDVALVAGDGVAATGSRCRRSPIFSQLVLAARP